MTDRQPTDDERPGEAEELEKAAQAISRVSEQIADAAVEEYNWHMRNQMRAILGR